MRQTTRVTLIENLSRVFSVFFAVKLILSVYEIINYNKKNS